jgi:pyruvate,orthophosphate dikinase
LPDGNSGLCCTATKLESGVLERSGARPLETVESAERFGSRAARLGAMIRAGLPVPRGFALGSEACDLIAGTGDPPRLPDGFGPVLSLRSSPGSSSWGGPPAILNIGLGEAALPELSARLGETAALDLYRRFIQTYAVRVEGLDPGDFANLRFEANRSGQTDQASALRNEIAACLAFYADETGSPFPDTLAAQLGPCLKAMLGAWSAQSARILRRARGAPEDASLGLVLQEMVFGTGQLASGCGVVQMVDEASGTARLTGRFLPCAQGQDMAAGQRSPHFASRAEREAAGQVMPSLEELHPEVITGLSAASDRLAQALGDRMRLGFTIENGQVWYLDATPARRSPRASIRIAVDLAEAGIISRERALLKVDPSALTETLHPQVDPGAARDVIAQGLAASPGAATGRIAFSAEAAMAMAAQGEATVLVRVETSPDDIRGMHSAKGVLTVRGGMTSHAAVIARGFGLPCIVGANELDIDTRSGVMRARDGRRYRQGDLITLDGSSGQVLRGAAQMIQPEFTGAVSTLMDWADAIRTIGVRANADTPADAALARQFGVDGIGLCRTEHMFFQGDRINVMREMILADNPADRASALTRLLPMQRGDFRDLFSIMEGLPVTIRLLDPPLHEFLPSSEDEIAALAVSMDRPPEDVLALAAGMREFNPMLGKRGVRLGITMPEIYDMQARAIFEAAAAAASAGRPVTPEIMIPLVSAKREVELVKSRVERVATSVRGETGIAFDYRIGVMIETPRGALRAGDIAHTCAFLSFGTNDLTQMTYGLSRDDSGRFMRDYVSLGVFPEDPFHTLDLEGVGELLLLAAKRARTDNPGITLGLCGEHGGDPASIRFCRVAGFDYVSCSPFRVPVARLAAAQASILVA